MAAEQPRSRRPVPRSLLVFAVLVLLAVLWGWGRSFVVLESSSMEPWAGPGDLLVHVTVAADELRVGDVVTVRQGERLVTHRVVRTAVLDDDTVRVRLQGDASPLPDPVPADLQGRVERVQLAVPAVGWLLTDGAPLLWLAGALVGGGVLVLWLQRRAQLRDIPTPADLPTPARPGGSAPGSTGAPHGPASQNPELETGDVRVLPVTTTPDPRVAALVATCEQLAEDGLAPPVLWDLVRVRTCEVLGLPRAERSGAALSLDDGARFYVLALADADADALRLVPPGSARRRAGSAAIDRWWSAVSSAVPSSVHDEIGPFTTAA